MLLNELTSATNQEINTSRPKKMEMKDADIQSHAPFSKQAEEKLNDSDFEVTEAWGVSSSPVTTGFG